MRLFLVTGAALAHDGTAEMGTAGIGCRSADGPAADAARGRRRVLELMLDTQRPASTVPVCARSTSRGPSHACDGRPQLVQAGRALVQSSNLSQRGRSHRLRRRHHRERRCDSRSATAAPAGLGRCRNRPGNEWGSTADMSVAAEDPAWVSPI